MSMGKALVVVGYFGGLGYLFAKTGADKQVGRLIKHTYTEIVRYTKEIDSPRVTLVEIIQPPQAENDGKGDSGTSAG